MLNLRAAGVAGLLSLASIALAQAANESSFDCSLAQTPAEQAICRDGSLRRADGQMAQLFGAATSSVLMGQRADLRDSQRAWLRQRDLCGADRACLSGAYADRIQQLNRALGAQR